MKARNSQKGFTLVEIMIVVVIIGLLAAMAIPAFQKVRASSQEKAIVNNLRQLASAAQQYFLEEGVSTVTSSELVGQGLYITTITPVLSEIYPPSIDTEDTKIEATNTGVTNNPIISFTL